MKIEVTVDENAVMLSLSGWLDAISAEDLKAAVDRLDKSVTDLVLDLDKLEYVSSAGLRQIVLAQKKMADRGSFALVRVPDTIMDVFRMTGLSERLNILS